MIKILFIFKLIFGFGEMMNFLFCLIVIMLILYCVFIFKLMIDCFVIFLVVFNFIIECLFVNLR